MSKGKLIAIEGIDGSGKTTQVELLKQALASPRSVNMNVASQSQILQILSFPRYEENVYGKLIKKYLEGRFGTSGEVNPYLMALVFSGDRVLAKPQIDSWLSEGKTVIVNRYVSSSKAHLGAHVPYEKREEFINWLDELEYHTNGLPKEDFTILLTVDPKIGQQNVLSGKPDIHEKNLKHLEEAYKIYLELAKKENNWYVVDCMKDGAMKTQENIHQEIMHIIQNKLND